jgi:hypothetical protein
MCSVPTTSTVSLRYEKLPYFLIQQIGEELDLDDRLNFMVGFVSVNIWSQL